MAIPKLFSLARMTTATTGTGTITLGAAATVGSVTYITFANAGVADGDVVAYGIQDTGGSNTEYGYGTYTAAGTTLTRNVIRSSNSNNAINLSGTAQVFVTAGNADLLWGFDMPRNMSLAASVAASALTITLNDAYAATPAALSPILTAFRSPTAATGTPVFQPVRASTTLVVSSGSTLGTSNNVPFRLQVVLFDDASTMRLGVINPTTGGVVNEDAVASSTAEGGAGAADSADTYYTGTAVSSKAFRIVGYLDYPSGLGTAGTWSAGPTTIKIAGGTRLPGIMQDQVFTASGTFTSPAGTRPTTVFKVTCVGGGGGGGGAQTNNVCGGGGGGAGAAIKWYTGLAASTGYTVTIGAAGTGQAAGGTGGSSGGNTTFAGPVTTITGGGGTVGAALSSGAGGTGTNGDVNVAGCSGGTGMGGTLTSYELGGYGGNAALGYGGGGAGGYGVNASTVTAGAAGTVYGGGGGGGGGSTTAQAAGGAGAAGIVIVEWVL